jgi:hypothetical protein
MRTRIADLIKSLDIVYLEFTKKVHRINNTYQSNDIRLSYYYLTYQNIDATTHLLISSEENLENETRVSRNYSKYGVRNRLDDFQNPEPKLIQIRNNLEQFIANQFSMSVFSLFEHSFRIIIKHCYPNDYSKMENAFMDMFKHFVREFGKYSQYFLHLDSSFFDFFNTVRNSIHTNGLFLPRNKNLGYSKIYQDLDGNTILCEYGKIIPYQGVWNSHIRMTEKFFSIFNEMLDVPRIRREHFIEDPSV